jgi:hypothetical protein
MLNLIIILGLAIPGVLIMALAAIFSKTRGVGIGWGIVGSVLMGLQGIFLFGAVGFGDAWSGDSGGDGEIGLLLLVFAAINFGYFVLIFRRPKRARPASVPPSQNS